MAKSLPEIVNVTDCKSVAVTVPTLVVPSSTTKVDDDVKTGAVVSVTLTVLVSVAVLPEASVEVYVIVYAPRVSASTVPDVSTVTSPEASVAVAPASVYEVPNSTVAGLSPKTVIVGAVVSTTLTVLVAVAVLPSRSVAV